MVRVGRDLKDHLVPTPLPWAAIPHWPGSLGTCEHKARLSCRHCVHCPHIPGTAGLIMVLPSTS